MNILIMIFFILSICVIIYLGITKLTFYIIYRIALGRYLKQINRKE